jgi:hypothetical protein
MTLPHRTEPRPKVGIARNLEANNTRKPYDAANSPRKTSEHRVNLDSNEENLLLGGIVYNWIG